jgi:hypothetical protein
MEDRELPHPTHDPHDGVPRGGHWVRWIVASFVLIVGVAFAPESWKMPLGALSIVALIVGVALLMKKPTGPAKSTG